PDHSLRGQRVDVGIKPCRVEAKAAFVVGRVRHRTLTNLGALSASATGSNAASRRLILGTCRGPRFPRAARPDTSRLAYSTRCLGHAQAVALTISPHPRPTLFFRVPRVVVVPPEHTSRNWQTNLRSNTLGAAQEHGS